MSARLRALTDEEVAALRAYKAREGRSWKTALWAAWMNAQPAGLLLDLRGSHGPTWLASYRMPKEEA